MLSHFSCVRLFATLGTVACQAPPSMGFFSRQEHWSGLPCPPPEDLPEPGIKSASPAAPALQTDSLPLGHQRSLILSGAISNFPELFPSSVLDIFQPGAHFPVSYLFAFSYCSWSFPVKKTGVGCHALLQWTTFCQNSSLCPVHLGWLCMAWLIASLNYARPFTTTRL